MFSLTAGFASTLRGADLPAVLHQDTITHLSVGDQFEVTGTRFSVLQYNGDTGVPQLDLSGIDSFALPINMPTGVVGELFVDHVVGGTRPPWWCA